MSEYLWIPLTVGVTLLLYFLHGWRLRNTFSSTEDFFNYAQRMPRSLFTKNFITTNVTFTSIFVVIAATTYQKGNRTLWIVIAWVIGLFLFRWIFPRVSSYFDSGRTLHEFLGTRYSSQRIRYLASACTLVAFLGTLGIEFWGVILLLKSLGLTNYLSTGMIAMFIAVITGTYTALGGFKAAVHTDRLQYAFIIALTAALLLAVFNVHGLYPSVDSTTRQSIVKHLFDVRNLFADPVFIAAMVIMFVPFNFCVMDMWQRCSATPANDRLRAIRSVTSPMTILSFVVTFTVPILIGLVAMVAASAAGAGSTSASDSVMVLPSFIHSIAGPSWLRLPVLCLIYAGFAAALLSTADTLLVVMAFTLLHDIIGPLRGIKFSEVPPSKKEHAIWLFRFWMFILVLLSLPIVYFGLSMYQMVLAVFSSQVALFVPILYAILRPAKSAARSRGAFWATLLSFLATFIAVGFGSLLRVPQMVDGAPVVAFAVSLIVFFVFPRTKVTA